MTISPVPSALGAVPMFAALDAETRQVLEAASRVRVYPRGQILCNEGDPGDDLLVLEAGRVRVSRFAASGVETVLAEVEAPAAFGELALIDGKPRAATLTALTDVHIRYLGREPVMALVEREPAVAIAMMRSLAAMVRATNERLGDVVAMDVSGRLAKWLLARASGDDRLTLGQSQESLARILGTTRETVNRTIHRFERLGLIDICGDTLRLCDRRGLEAISEG